MAKKRTASKTAKKGKFGAKVKKITTKIGKITKKIVVTSAVAPLIAPLIPFFPIMTKALKTKGITPPKAPLDLIKSFYSNVVKKASLEDSIEDIPANLEYLEENVIGAISATIVKNIIEFIKNIKNKKASGQPLSPSEDVIDKESDKLPPSDEVTQTITEGNLKTGDETSGTMPGGDKIKDGEIIPGKGNFFDKYKMLIIGGAVALVVIYFVIKKK